MNYVKYVTGGVVDSLKARIADLFYYHLTKKDLNAPYTQASDHNIRIDDIQFEDNGITIHVTGDDLQMFAALKQAILQNELADEGSVTNVRAFNTLEEFDALLKVAYTSNNAPKKP